MTNVVPCVEPTRGFIFELKVRALQDNDEMLGVDLL